MNMLYNVFQFFEGEVLDALQVSFPFRSQVINDLLHLDLLHLFNSFYYFKPWPSSLLQK